MKLYYATGACALSPHIVANELGLKFETEKVDLRAHTTAGGKDYYQISPKGAVPSLQLENGEVLTEGAVICQYLCDQKPGNKMLPAVGNIARYRVLEWLNFVASEIHKGYSPLFGLKGLLPTESAAQEFSGNWKKNLVKKYDTVEKALAKSEFLTGSEFTPADAYLFTVTNWAKALQVDLTGYPKLMGFMERVQARPAVQAAMATEGLK